jgi:hypothetical protein
VYIINVVLLESKFIYEFPATGPNPSYKHASGIGASGGVGVARFRCEYRRRHRRIPTRRNELY